MSLIDGIWKHPPAIEFLTRSPLWPIRVGLAGHRQLHEITLLMANGRISQHCYIVWRRPTRVGVTFDRLNEPTIDSLPHSVKSVS
jgi:hypothetical protein